MLFSGRKEMAEHMAIFTIGYEGLDVDDFLTLLCEYGIQTVVDIRAVPLSRKRGFSKTALIHTLGLHDITYRHVVALGCPKPVRDDYRMDGDWSRYRVGFMAHLRRQRPAVAALADWVQSSTCALLCFEADYNFCHRSLVANAFQKQYGASVTHIPVVKTTTSVARQRAFA